MLIAGVPVENHAVALLEQRLPEPLARRLRMSRLMGTNVLGLTAKHRETLLAALEDPPHGLEELRDVLRSESERRTDDGLVRQRNT